MLTVNFYDGQVHGRRVVGSTPEHLEKLMGRKPELTEGLPSQSVVQRTSRVSQF